MSFTKSLLNLSAVFLLATLIATPLYFAKNFAKVAGVKSENKYLVVSQTDKFPNITLTQTGDQFTVNYNKFSDNQAFLGILVLYNPTSEPQTYSLVGDREVFFGQNLEDKKNQITVPSGASISISIHSQSSSQSSKFSIH